MIGIDSMTGGSAATTDGATAPHILVVDDEVVATMALERFLERRGFRVTTAFDGRQALDAHARDAADVVVTDMRMPRLGGRELIQALRGPQPELPVVVVTGFLSSDDEAAALVGPHTAVMTKPLDPEALLRTLKGLLGG
ncbi:response regulator [Rhodocista pekingensis]|uniref:Response regulator n=1 Tax=Rhodocista pekingensis TaxID=201185 RepID=A0ABW2KTI1_9PROT